MSKRTRSVPLQTSALVQKRGSVGTVGHRARAGRETERTMTIKSRIYFPKRGKERKLAKIKKRCKPIARVSERQKHRLIVYGQAKRNYLRAHPICEVCQHFYDTAELVLPVLHKSTELHHRRGRVGALLVDPRFFMAVCAAHHRIIHENPKESRKYGFIGPWGKQTP